MYEINFFTFTEIPEKLVCKFYLKFLLQNVSPMFTPQGIVESGVHGKNSVMTEEKEIILGNTRRLPPPFLLGNFHIVTHCSASDLRSISAFQLKRLHKLPAMPIPKLLHHF